MYFYKEMEKKAALFRPKKSAKEGAVKGAKIGAGIGAGAATLMWPLFANYAGGKRATVNILANTISKGLLGAGIGALVGAKKK